MGHKLNLVIYFLFFTLTVNLQSQTQSGLASDGGGTGESTPTSLNLGDRDPSYTGDLNLNLPIMTVPGRNGLNFDINLTYSSNIIIPRTHKESWVGLGFELKLGEVMRSVIGRVDEQTIGMFSGQSSDFNLPCMTNDCYIQKGFYDSPAEQNGSFSGDPNSWTDDPLDSYYLSFPGGADKLIPSTAWNSQQDDSPWATVNYKAWRIDFIQYSGDMICSFSVIDENGTRYIFDQVVNTQIIDHRSYLTNPIQPQLYVFFEFPTRWLLTEIHSANYVDILPTGCGEEDMGSWIKIEYAGFEPETSAEEGITIEKFYYDPNYVDIKYPYPYPTSIETPTYKANFSIASKPSTVRKSLQSISLVDKSSSKVIKTINFSYGTNTLFVGHNGNWQNGECLVKDKYALQDIQETTGDGEPTILYKFTYGDNPYFGYTSETNHSGLLLGTSHIAPWRLKNISFSDGMCREYIWETKMYNWYIKANDIYTAGTQPGVRRWTYSASAFPYDGFYRISKTIDKEKENSTDPTRLNETDFSYGEGVMSIEFHENIQEYFGMNVYATNSFIKFNGNVEYRWIQRTNSTGLKSQKNYFTTGLPKPDFSGMLINFDNSQLSDPILTSEARGSFFRAPDVKFVSNEGGRGLIWKTEKMNSSNPSQVVESSVNNFTDIAFGAPPLFQKKGPILMGRVSLLESSTTTRDGVSNTVNYQYYRNSSLPKKIMITNSLGQKQTTVIDYESEFTENLSQALSISNVLSPIRQIRKYDGDMEASISQIKYSELYKWEANPGYNNLAYNNFYMTEKSIWKGLDFGRTYSGTTVDFALEQLFLEHDGFGNVLLEKDAKGILTRYLYDVTGSRLISKIKNIPSATPSAETTCLFESFNYPGTISNANNSWTRVNFILKDNRLYSHGEGYAYLGTSNAFMSKNFSAEVQFKLIDDHGNNSNWIGIHFGCTDMSNINDGYLVFYRKNDQLVLYKNGAYLVTISTGMLPNKWRRMSVSTSGNNIKVLVDGKQLINYSGTINIPTGFVGLYAFDVDAVFDNYRVSPSGTLAESYAYDPNRMIIESIDMNLNSSFLRSGSGGMKTQIKNRLNGKEFVVSETKSMRRLSSSALLEVSDCYKFSKIESNAYPDSSGFTDFSEPSYWTNVGGTPYFYKGLDIPVNTKYCFDYPYNGENTLRLGKGYDDFNPETANIHKDLSSGGDKFAKVDFYIDYSDQTDQYVLGMCNPVIGDSILIHFWRSGDILFTVEFHHSNFTTTYLFDQGNSINDDKTVTPGWYTVEMEKTADGAIYIYVYNRDKGKNRSATGSVFKVSATEISIPAPRIFSKSLNGYGYYANFYCGKRLQEIKIIDEFGREKQVLQRTGETDIVHTTKEYNQLGSLIRVYKPYERTVGTLDKHFYDGSYGISSNNYYNFQDIDWDTPTSPTDMFPYSIINYSDDVLQRPTSVYSPGVNWRERPTIYEYSSNTTGDNLRLTGYGAGSLYKESITDAQGMKISSFKDKFGKKIAEIVNPDNADVNLRNETNFNYDFYGNLTSVTSPKGLVSNYLYNTIGKVTQKTTPDEGTTQYLYDKNGNLRFVKDANHAVAGVVNDVDITWLVSWLTTGTFSLVSRGMVDIEINEPLWVESGSNGIITFQIKNQDGVILYTLQAGETTEWYADGSVFLPEGNYSYTINGENIDPYPNNDILYTIRCKTNYDFVYNNYDNFGRIKETGEFENAGSGYFTQNYAESQTTFGFEWQYHPSIKNNFDYPATYANATGQRNLKGRISWTESYRLDGLVTREYYSYDEMGRVEWIVIWGLGWYDKKINYKYDLLGNLVRKDFVAVNGMQMHDSLYYDTAGRLLTVKTSGDPNMVTGVETEAVYQYFASGKQKRLKLGKAQGVDYRYNERGWLSMINHQNLTSTDDPGQDGNPGEGRSQYTDKFGMIIGYNNVEGHIGDPIYQNATPQWNGNISWLMYNMSGVNFTYPGTTIQTPLVGNTYSYDALNRLTNSNFGWYYYNLWRSTSAFDASYSYDKDGNFQTKAWNNNLGSSNNMYYSYYGSPQNNQLSLTSGTGGYLSYSYDKNGNVAKDQSKNISLIIYDINNLPVTVYTPTQEIRYSYDGAGNRIRKQIINTTSGAVLSDVYYVNGADGKTEAVAWSYTGSNYTYNIWGNDLIGQIRTGIETINRFYYLKDHLGTIRMTVDADANVVGYDDYYPYGMVMPTRSFASSSEDSRYKFTSKERDAETTYDYFGARYYDSRIGRWLSVDPMAEKYPGLSPYNYCLNNPVKYIDPNGKYVRIKTGRKDERGNDIYITYTPGMSADGYEDFVAAVINSLNAIYSNDGGKKVLKELIKSSANYDFKLGTNNKFYRTLSQDKGGEIDISDGSTYKVAHESFHAFEQEKGMGGASWWSETQAYAFTYKIMKWRLAGGEPLSKEADFVSSFNSFLKDPSNINLANTYRIFDYSIFNKNGIYTKFKPDLPHQDKNFILELFKKK